jgi:hypothetical protein
MHRRAALDMREDSADFSQWYPGGKRLHEFGARPADEILADPGKTRLKLGQWNPAAGNQSFRSVGDQRGCFTIHGATDKHTDVLSVVARHYSVRPEH